MISLCDKELKQIVFEKKNLLEIINYKLLELTMDVNDSAFDIFDSKYA